MERAQPASCCINRRNGMSNPSRPSYVTATLIQETSKAHPDISPKGADFFRNLTKAATPSTSRRPSCELTDRTSPIVLVAPFIIVSLTFCPALLRMICLPCARKGAAEVGGSLHGLIRGDGARKKCCEIRCEMSGNFRWNGDNRSGEESDDHLSSGIDDL